MKTHNKPIGSENISSSHKSSDNNHEQLHKYCYAELKEEGSCNKHKEDKCYFDHNIPENLKENRENTLKINQNSIYSCSEQL